MLVFAYMALIVSVFSAQVQSFQFQIHDTTITTKRSVSLLLSSITDQADTNIDSNMAIQLKDDLVELAASTNRGFSASRSERDKAKSIINNLAKYSSTPEPAAAYYKDGGDKDTTSTLKGKWTLIYTDAPDITSLDSGGPFATAKLGRIGQECNPPSIKNVIEWERPNWASNLPFSGNESSRVLQKVCCEGVANSDKPTTVDLSIVGLEINGRGSSGESSNSNGLLDSILNGPSAFLESNPIDLKGPLTAPFGNFDILYLDMNMRITKTYQGYYAVNTRISKEDEWF